MQHNDKDLNAIMVILLHLNYVVTSHSLSMHSHMVNHNWGAGKVCFEGEN